MRKTLSYFIAGVLLSLLAFPSFAGTVRTKDTPKKDGGYYNDSYHLKRRGENKGFVEREHNWRNPFKGFTKDTKQKKVKTHGEMPHSP